MSSTYGNYDPTASLLANTYKDFNGTMGFVLQPIMPNSDPKYDENLNNLLSLLKKEGKYSKDIQNLKIDNKYETGFEDWKAWIEYNKKHQKDLLNSFMFKYIDLHSEVIKESIVEKLEKVLKEFSLYEENSDQNIFSEVLKHLNYITGEINTFRTALFHIQDLSDDILDVVREKLRVMFAGSDNTSGSFWEAQENIRLDYSSFLKLKEEEKVSDVQLTELFRILERLNNSVRNEVEKLIKINNNKLVSVVSSDFKEWRRMIDDENSLFWTEEEIPFTWDETEKFLGGLL